MSHEQDASRHGRRTAPRPRWALATALAVTLAAGGVLPGLALAGERDRVVVTTEILGAVVSQLVGEAGEVIVLMPSGANPHTWEPSARDVERVLSADVVVSNGLGLEEGLVDVLASAQAEGVTWFEATDHVTLLDLREPGAPDEHDEATDAAADERDHEDEEHDHGMLDPHFWTDPLAMAEVVTALAPVLGAQGLDVSASVEALVAELEALDAEVAAILAAVPAETRKLVTGHRSLGYFAERYGFEQVGSVIGSLSTGAEPTARELAELIEQVREQDVPAVFTEVGTPQSVAEAVAADAGAELVELSAAQLPEEGTYAAFLTGLAGTIAEALEGEAR